MLFHGSIAWPASASVNASPALSPPPAHDSRSTWFATPSSWGSFLPDSPALSDCPSFLFPRVKNPVNSNFLSPRRSGRFGLDAFVEDPRVVRVVGQHLSGVAKTVTVSGPVDAHAVSSLDIHLDQGLEDQPCQRMAPNRLEICAPTRKRKNEPKFSASPPKRKKWKNEPNCPPDPRSPEIAKRRTPPNPVTYFWAIGDRARINRRTTGTA